jgi:hypothetical protein
MVSSGQVNSSSGRFRINGPIKISFGKVSKTDSAFNRKQLQMPWVKHRNSFQIREALQLQVAVLVETAGVTMQEGLALDWELATP